MAESKKKQILLVEDEVVIGMSETIQLQKYGYDVIHVINGSEAIEAVRNNKNIDLILMDINLGTGLDGPETAIQIIKDHDIPIIFLSSHIERDIVDKTENITSYGYVVKNSKISVLDASMKMAFRLHEAYLELKKQKSDIDDKKKMLEYYERRYRRLFESAKDGILILNAETGMIEDVNPFLVEMLGYSKEQFLKKYVWEINAFRYIDYSKKLFKELQEKEYVRYTDLPLETYDGKIVHVEFVSNVYLVESEKVIQCNVRDIEDRVKYEKKLINNIDEKDTLIREIQHRTKNSFNMITSLIHLRSNSAKSAEIAGTLEELTLRVQSISDLYSLLYETGSFTNVQLKEYCSKVIGSMLNMAGNIQMGSEMDDLTVSSKDAASIGMILIELITNAIKYAFPDNRRGKIGVTIKKENSGLILKVEDNGVGMRNDFEKETANRIGLHLVDLLVKQLKGSIDFTNDGGTKIRIQCPL